SYALPDELWPRPLPRWLTVGRSKVSTGADLKSPKVLSSRDWRRRTGVEPARPSYLVSSALKTAGTARSPDATKKSNCHVCRLSARTHELVVTSSFCVTLVTGSAVSSCDTTFKGGSWSIHCMST